MMNQTDMDAEVAATIGVGGKSRGRKGARLFRWLLVLCGAGAAAALLLTRDPAEPINHYETATAERGDLVVTISAVGTLEPLKTVDVGSEVSGTIAAVEVDYNDKVSVGQVLARIDTSKLQAQTLQSEAALDAAKASLQQSKATVQEAEAQLKRLNKLHESSGGKLPAAIELEAQKATVARSRADQDSARAAIAQAEATLKVNRSDLEKATIISPIDGVVLTRSAEPGQTVAAAFTAPVLFTLAEDLTQMELQVDVDEADVGQVQAGQLASFTVDAYPDATFTAETAQVRYGAETTEGVVTYTTVLRVQNDNLKLRPGMTATSLITVDQRENALLIPNAALRFAPLQEAEAQRGGGLVSMILPRPPSRRSQPRPVANPQAKEQQVWVLQNGQLMPVNIVKGLSDGLKTEVVGGGLEAGMEVVTNTITETS